MDNMKRELDSFDPQLKKSLDSLNNVPDRNPNAAMQGRAKFLSQAQNYKKAVSQGSETRHKGWMINIFGLRKETFRMSTLATILAIIGLILGGSGATVFASQASLPGDFLYPVKTVTEDSQYQLTTNNQARFELMLEFSARRVEEIKQLIEQGEMPPEPLLARLQNHLDQSLRLMLTFGDPEFSQAMFQYQQTLQEQNRIMAQLAQDYPNDPALARIQTILQTRLQLAEQGLKDPVQFRNQYQNQPTDSVQPLDESQDPGKGPFQNKGGNENPGNPWTDDTPTPYSGYGEGNGGNPWVEGTPTPGSGYGDGNGGNPYTTGTPTPGSGYGDGNGGNPYTTGTPTPGSGYGDGNGGNPYTTGTPTPGSGYGDGNGGNPYATGTPTPGSGYGPGESGSGK